MAVLGDIALVGYKSDNPDGFAFVLLADLSGETITFTDNGALAAGGLRTGEGVLTYTVPANTPAGTVITISSVGTMAFSTDGDQLIAYVGTSTSPTFLFALEFADGNTLFASDATNSNTSAVPAGLTAGTNALAFGADNGAYAGSLTGTKAEILANIANAANWVFSESAGQTYPGNFTITTGAAAQVSINDVSITEGDAGTSLLTFTVTRSDASGAFSVDYATANGTATAGSDYVAASGTLNFTAGGALSQTVSVTITGDTGAEANETFTVVLSNLMNSSGTAAIADASGTGTISNDDITFIAIHDIQGAAHTSPLVGQVVTTRGIVTAVDTNGFYIQTPDADIDASDATSQGIFIFTSSAPTVAAGDGVTVTGTVSEFTPGGAGTNNLSSTQLISPTISVQSSGNALPTAIILGAGGRTPPTEIIDNDNFATFDPGSDGIDFFESLEGMRVTVPNPLVVAPTTSDRELFTVADGGTGATGLSARGTIVTRGSNGDGLNVTNTGAGSDYNPERIQIDGDSFTPGGANSIPLVAAGTVLNNVTGIVSYGFGNYEVLATTAVTVATPSILTGEVTNLVGTAETLTIASYNVLNLDPNDSDGDTDVADGRFTSIALQIVNALGSPDIVALQEIQDNSGSANDGTVSASVTLQMLVDAIAAGGGPAYSFIDHPFITNNTNGGEPGGNIRVAYLYDASRVALVPGSVATTLNAATDFAGSRPPLVASFEFNGETVTVINNHFSSKGGSSPLFGAVQPSINGSAADRLVQAQNVANHVSSLGSNAKVVVLGDLNEFTNEESLAPLGVAGLSAMSLTLPETERYSYNFEGNAQELDQVYVSGNLTATTTLDIVHVNSEFVTTAATASDHDPSVIAINIAAPGPAPFAAGDIAFVGFNADGNDDLAFVALREIPTGTVIYFNDREWTGAGFNTGEGELVWTASSTIAAGTVVTINNFGSTPVSNLGTTSGSSGLSTGSEIVYAYVGAPGAPTAFLAAITNNGFTADGGTLSGTGLVAGTTAIDLAVVDAGAEIGVFNGARNGQTSYAGFLAQINNPANWLTQDTVSDDSIDTVAPDLPFSVAGFTLGAAEVQSVGFGSTSLAQAEGNNGTTAFVFTVARTGGTTGALDFSGSFAAGATDAADYAGNSVPTGFSGTILAGATSATVTISVAGDTSVESSEGFSLTLTSVSNGAGVSASIQAGLATATGTITNDDLAPAAFGPGDVAFVGFNSDGADNLALVALKELPTGTVLYFTDNEWNGTTWADFNESAFALTLTNTVSAGSIITIDAIGTAASTVSNVGTVANVTGGGGNRGIGNSGEQVYVYIASAGSPLTPTAFLAAVSNDGFAGTGGNGTLTGTGLEAGTSAINLATADAGADIAAFTGARSNQTSFANYLASINNAANWVTQDASGDQSADSTAPDVPFSGQAFSLAAAAQTIGFANASLTRLVDEGNSGSKLISFTVERSGGTVGQLDFTGSFAAGTTDAADFGGSLPTGFSGSIAAGASSATVTIAISGDTSIEPNESFTLTLTGGSNPATAGVLVNAGTAVASLTIVTDDYPLAIGGIDVHGPAASLAGSASTPVASDDVVLVRLGSITGAVAGAESIAFEGGKIYATNIAGNAINVHSVTAAGTLVNESPILLSGLPSYLAGGVNSVDVKNGIIAVGYENADPAQAGFVALFNAADNSLIKTIQVGILPDDVTFTPDGTKLLVANEGEALAAQGSVSIIDLSGGAANAVVSNTISFASLNGAEAALRGRGLAIAPGQPAAGDIEPEYITISADGSRAYVTLQEVNAIAVIDLTNPAADRPLAIQPLGTIDRNLAGNALDTSDSDGGINLRNVDIVSLPQPDAVASFVVGGVTYLVTANEGDSRVNLTDSVRLSASSYILDPTRFPNAAAMKANADLGRLNVLSNLGDTDGDGDIDVIHTLGGRSLSIFRQEADGSLTKVRETGGEFEAIIAANHPAIFNSNQSTASNSRDTRSDDKGPEPEGVSIGVVAGRTYAFVGLERVGGYIVYDVTDPANARFVTYKPQTGADLGPETSTFVAAVDSPTGQALLLSAQEISNSVTLYSVQTQSDGNDVINGGSDGERWNGRGGNDVINGNGGDDIIDGGAGSDTLNGGIGADTASFASASGGVVAHLGTGTATGPGGDADILVDFENLLGSAYDDTLTGNGDANVIEGGAGDDRLDGGLGIDTASYAGAGSAVTVSLALSGTAQNTGGAGSDTLRNFENLTGSDFGDVLTGDWQANVLAGGKGGDSLDGGIGDDTVDGGEGDDLLIGGRGSDIVRGGAGIDTASYAGGPGATVDLMLAGAQDTGLGQLDTLIDIENLIGSSSNDTLGGNAGDNRLDGAAGTDTVSYARALAGVTVSLALQGAAQNTLGAGTDTLINFENLTGSAFNDTLAGDAGRNVLDGGAGIDTLTYAAATAGVSISLALTFSQNSGGAGLDLVRGFENLIGSAFNDRLSGDAGANLIAGGNGDDSLDGGNGDDTLEGDEGDDLLIGGLGSDTLRGGAGVDTASYAGGPAATVDLTLSGAQDTGSGQFDTLIDIENLIGSSGDDTLGGNAGDNRLDGAAGRDTVSYARALAGVTVSLALQGAAQDTLGAGTDTLSNFENLTGSDFGDVLTGDWQANVLAGGKGGDSLDGGIGDDTLDSGEGDDLLIGGRGSDILRGGAGIDTASYAGGPAATVDLMLAGAQDTGLGQLDTLIDIENLIGSSGNDTLGGNAGDNSLDGGAGLDTVSYARALAGVTVSLALQGAAQDTLGAGNDTLAGFENLVGSAFNDTLAGDAGRNIIDGGAGIDTLSYAAAAAGVSINLAVTTAQGTGGAGIDTVRNVENLIGSAFDDRLSGDAADNVLAGGAGADRVSGGGGGDLFQFAAIGDFGTGGARDLISDFNRSEGDRIDLSGIDPDGILEGDQSFLFIGTNAFSGVAGELRFDQNAGVFSVSGDLDGDQIADFTFNVAGPGLTTLQAADFVL